MKLKQRGIGEWINSELEDGVYLILSYGEWELLRYEEDVFYYYGMPIKKAACAEPHEIYGPLKDVKNEHIF